MGKTVEDNNIFFCEASQLTQASEQTLFGYLVAKMIQHRCTGDLDESVNIKKNMNETSWQKCASFHVQMFV